MISLVITGEPASKANSRRQVPAVTKAGKAFMRPIKSAKALSWLQSAAKQVKPISPLLTGDLVAHIRIYYASRLPDLDESLILDFLQGRIYRNDRQVRERHVYWGLDRINPRAEIVIERGSVGVAA